MMKKNLKIFNIDKFVNLEKNKNEMRLYEKIRLLKPIEISNDNVSPKREIICYKKNSI